MLHLAIISALPDKDIRDDHRITKKELARYIQPRSFKMLHAQGFGYRKISLAME
jgi:hypothetical protein